MPSTYTTNLGIEKIATGEQSGTWGVTTNTNFDLIDQAVNGIVSITLSSAGSSGSPNALEITDGSASNGRNKFIEFVDGGDLGGTAFVQLTPNDAEKIVIIRNSLSGSQSLIVFQGTYSASNDFEVSNGKDVVLKFSGSGTGATVTQVFDDLLITALSATTVAATTGNITTVNATTVDATNVEATNLKAKDGTAAITVADSTGQVTIADAVLTTADINGGNIDGTAIGATTPSTANISTLSLGGVQVTANAGEINQLDGITSAALENNDIGTSVLAYDANLQGFVSALTLPTTDGSANQALVTNGSGTISFADMVGGIAYVVKTANYTTQTDEGVLADTSGGAFTVTLPASPTTGDQVVVADPAGNWGSNNLTIGRNGETISDVAEDLVCDISGASVQLVYDGTTWAVYAQVGGNGGTVATLDGTQTLTNKTLAATTMSGTLSMADNIISRPVLEDYAIQGSAIGNTGATQTFDLSTANFFSATLDQNCTFTFSNPPASGDFGGFILELTNGGAHTISYPSSVDFAGGTAPTLTASGVDQLVFTTRDGGTTYFALVAGLDIKSPS